MGREFSPTTFNFQSTKSRSTPQLYVIWLGWQHSAKPHAEDFRGHDESRSQARMPPQSLRGVFHGRTGIGVGVVRRDDTVQPWGQTDLR